MTHFILKITTLTLFLSCALASSAWAEKSYKTIQAVGVASSTDKALAKALNNAVSQVNGSVVSQKIDVEESEDKIVMGIFGQSVVIPSKEINKGFTRSYSEGVIKSYSVTDTSYYDESKTYRITIQAEVEYLAEYKNIGADRSQLIPMAVTNFKVQTETLQGLNGPESSADVSLRLSDNLTQQLAASEQFRLLDRANLPRSLVEQVITHSLGAKTGQKVNFDQQLSAELLVVASIKDFNISANAVESYGMSFDSYYAELRLDIRVIETATGDIRLAKQFEQHLSHDQIKQQLDNIQKNIFIANKASDKRRIQYAIESVLMQEISLAIIKQFYPNYEAMADESSMDKKDEANNVNASEQSDGKTPLSDSPGSSEKPVEW